MAWHAWLWCVLHSSCWLLMHLHSTQHRPPTAAAGREASGEVAGWGGPQTAARGRLPPAACRSRSSSSSSAACACVLRYALLLLLLRCSGFAGFGFRVYEDVVWRMAYVLPLRNPIGH
jgi:hypothetical protein